MIEELIKKRRTIRKFKNQKISTIQLKKYIDLARLAPSGANLQPLKYAIINSKEMVDKVFELTKWAGYLAPLYDPKENERPVCYIAVCADTEIRATGYELDAGAAIEHIILSALEDGVGACWLGAIDRPELKKLLSLEDNINIISLVALGYPDESPKDVGVSEDIKYYLDESETLCVPKRELKEIIIKEF